MSRKNLLKDGQAVYFIAVENEDGSISVDVEEYIQTQEEKDEYR